MTNMKRWEAWRASQAPIQEFIKENPTMFAERNGGFDLPSGWVKPVLYFLKKLKREIEDEEIEIVQIKEKFAGLRIYVNKGGAHTQKFIDAAEIACGMVCQDCGTIDESVRIRGNGWLRNLCDNCQTKRKNEKD